MSITIIQRVGVCPFQFIGGRNSSKNVLKLTIITDNIIINDKRGAAYLLFFLQIHCLPYSMSLDKRSQKKKQGKEECEMSYFFPRLSPCEVVGGSWWAPSCLSQPKGHSHLPSLFGWCKRQTDHE